jgi:GH15 family glucan-1,4-alpha-glucosidase
MGVEERYPPLADYGLIGDRGTCALVSRGGSIDWCCLPRFDSGAAFARLLDREDGGHCVIALEGARSEHRYLDDTLVLETRWTGERGEARVIDFFARPVREGCPVLMRIVEGISGRTELSVEVSPRFDYGALAPWLRGEGGVFTAIGGDDGLLIRTDLELEMDDEHRLVGKVALGEGERRRLQLEFRPPVELDSLADLDPLDPGQVDDELERALEWWREWRSRVERDDEDELLIAATRSALVLNALSYEPTGAIAAAATTSLPEARDLTGARNWDYRYSWIRDSALAVRSLAELGWVEDADAFRRFVERSSAGQAADIQVLFGVGGERRLGEYELDHLEGYRGSRPVRLGNQAAQQLQLDAFGQIVDQSWRWHLRGNSPDEDYWRFLVDVIETAIERWREPDSGIWEWRSEPRHFVQSKALAWAAIDRGIRLAQDTGKEVPEGWPAARDEVAAAIESRGYDEERGVFVQAFDSFELDAALLRLPTIDFVEWTDERMMRTAATIQRELDLGGLLRRHNADDRMPEEGAFLPCSFWLASCFAHQGRQEEAEAVFERAAATANELGLFAEEYDPDADRMLGNFPQALTHLSHIEAILALRGRTEREADSAPAGRVAIKASPNASAK